MKKLGIILPGNIGDIIICLPIAKWYADRGYQIYWPLYNFLYPNFIDATNYVNFISIPVDNCINTSLNTLMQLGCEILDLSFTSPYSWNNQNTKDFLNQTDYSFDEFRYILSKVPISEKWNLQINRNALRERKLFDRVVTNINNYTVIQTNSSDVSVKVNLDLTQYTGQIIDLLPITTSIFDWLVIIERAKNLVLVESCFTNLIDQLSIKNKNQFLILKPNYYRDMLKDGKRRRGFPVLLNNWQII